MKLLLTIITITLIPVSLLAQQTLNRDGGTINILYSGKQATETKNIKGTAYVDENFRDAEVLSKAHEVKTILRYNAVLDVFEFSKDDKVFYLNKSFDYVINFKDASNDTYHTIRYSADSIGYGQPLILDSTLDYALYKRSLIKFIPEKKAASSYDKDEPARFSDVQQRYYLRKPGEKFVVEVPLKKRVFDELGGTKFRKEIEKQKIKYKTEEGLTETVKLYFESSGAK